MIFEYKAADAFEIDSGHRVGTLTPPVMLRGQAPRFARLGRIAPMMPAFPEKVTSLYDLQAKSRAAR